MQCRWTQELVAGHLGDKSGIETNFLAICEDFPQCTSVVGGNSVL